MSNHIRFCRECGRYTLKGVCCNAETSNPRPARFGAGDRFVKYRLCARSGKDV